MNEKVLLVIDNCSEQQIDDMVFQWATIGKRQLVVLQLLDSHLYNYGKRDWIVPSYARTQFLFHIQNNLEEEGATRERELKKRAEQMKIDMVTKTIETDDAIGIVTLEARKGYDFILVPKKKRRLLPIVQELTFAKALKKQGLGPVIEY